MADNYESVAAVLRIVGDELRKLKPDQIEQLVEGKASFVFLPPGASLVITGPDAAEVRARLAAAETRQKAAAYLQGLNLKKPELVSLARQLGIAVASKDVVAEIRRKIVQGTAGTREEAAAILGGSWKP
jgi:hypothetical protein